MADYTVVDVVEAESTVVEVTEDAVAVLELVDASTTIIESGERGDRGPQGEPGPSLGSYTHTQDVPSATWTVTHDLGFNPAVTVVDSSRRAVEGDVEYLSVDHLRITFAAAFGGQAFLS